MKQSGKVPLEKNQWGEISDTMKRFLQINLSSKYYVRLGVENNRDQSFVASVSTLYSLYKLQGTELDYNVVMNKKLMSIKNFKEILISSLNIDTFASIQNGDLHIMFYNDQKIMTKDKIKEYKNSLLYSDDIHFERLVNSYEEFQKFILSGSSHIHFYHIWDIVKRVLLKNECNIIMIEQQLNGNIHLLCPPNNYDDQFERFNINKPSAIILKHDSFYEPLIFYDKKDMDEGFHFLHTYNKKKNNLDKFLSNISQLYRNHAFCGVQPSTLHKKYPYVFSYNTGEYIYDVLLNSKVVVKKQVVNHQFKNIGYLIDFKSTKIYFPVYPTRFLDDVPHVSQYSDEMKKYLQDYKTTVNTLNKIFELTNNEIPCKVSSKLIKNNHIIGVFTQARDYIPVKESNLVDDNIPIDDKLEEDGLNPFEVNQMILNTTDINPIMKSDMQLLYENQQWYDIFKSTVVANMTQLQYRNRLDQIHLIVNSEHYDYESKVAKIILIIRESSNIVFSDKVTSSSDDNITTSIPKFHLLNGTPNEENFYNRLVDEFIRYPQLKQFTRIPMQYMSDTITEYNLGKSELLSYESLLNSEFFNSDAHSLKLYRDNYNIAYPRKSIVYRNDVFDDKILNNYIDTGSVMKKIN